LKAAPHRIDKLVVIGVGLIGGSFALALRPPTAPEP
jgi:prephenate dehydrogenase